MPEAYQNKLVFFSPFKWFKCVYLVYWLFLNLEMMIFYSSLLNIQVWILCNDCGANSEVPFHIIAHKCSSCSSYNTRQTKGPSPNSGLGRWIMFDIKFLNILIDGIVLTRSLVPQMPFLVWSCKLSQPKKSIAWLEIIPFIFTAIYLYGSEQ